MGIYLYLLPATVLFFLYGSCFASADVISYRWEDAAGVWYYTDDEKRIPEAYRETAERLTVGHLREYKRFTRVEPRVFTPLAREDEATTKTLDESNTTSDDTQAKPERRRKRHRSDRKPTR